MNSFFDTNKQLKHHCKKKLKKKEKDKLNKKYLVNKAESPGATEDDIRSADQAIKTMPLY